MKQANSLFTSAFWDMFFKIEFKDFYEKYERIQKKISVYKSTIMLLYMLFFAQFLQAQHYQFHTGIGLGKPYIIESIEEKNELTIGFTPFFTGGIKYKPTTDNNWSLVLSVQYFEARAKGITKISQTEIDGFISNSSFFLIAEKEKALKLNPKWRFINGYGIGLSAENYIYKAEAEPRKNNYVSALLYVGLSRNINDRLSICVTNRLLITDLVKGVHYLLGNWTGQSAGEDISDFLSIGLNYKL